MRAPRNQRKAELDASASVRKSWRRRRRALQAAKADAESEGRIAGAGASRNQGGGCSLGGGAEAAEEAKQNLSPVSVLSAARRSGSTSAKATAGLRGAGSDSATRTSQSAPSSSPLWIRTRPAACAGMWCPCTRTRSTSSHSRRQSRPEGSEAAPANSRGGRGGLEAADADAGIHRAHLGIVLPGRR